MQPNLPPCGCRRVRRAVLSRPWPLPTWGCHSIPSAKGCRYDQKTYASRLRRFKDNMFHKVKERESSDSEKANGK